VLQNCPPRRWLAETANYKLARSARGGCGKRGPAPLLSIGFLIRGLAQLLAAQREARFCESHIFEHPACVLACAHLQEHPAAFMPPRRRPGASANRLNEQRTAEPRARLSQRVRKKNLRERTERLMNGFCARSQQKPMEHAAKSFCYPGNRTSSHPLSKTGGQFRIDNRPVPVWLFGTGRGPLTGPVFSL
jgi:hypothetical protein